MLPKAGSPDGPAGPTGAASQGLVAPQLWILAWWKDLPLFVATPLLIVPLALLLRRYWSAEQIFAFVAAFGATGHHLPGMMRAYGDSTLFRRFRVRFIVSPIVLGGMCAAYSVWDLEALTLLAYLWGIWHGAMQTYGFVRIYDVKVKSVDPWVGRLDLWMCGAWFIGAVLLSPERVRRILGIFYDSGGVEIPGQVVAGIIAAVPWVLTGVTAVFLVHMLSRWTQGKRVSPVKLVLMVTSFGFWWYTNVTVGSLLVGIALFEIFHDVQYLSIVWMYNRRRTRESAPVSSFLRFVFGRSGALVGVYVGLVFAYGYLAWMVEWVPQERMQRALEGLIVASGLLHFYFDGFIWKVREAPTRASLGLEGGGALSAGAGPPPWLRHGAKWMLLIAPVVWLGLTQLGGTLPEITRARSVAAALPADPIAQYNLGTALEAEGQGLAAMDRYHAALALDPQMADAHVNLGNLLAARGEPDAAIGAYRAALEARPEDALAHHNLGIALMNQGLPDQAKAHIREAVRIDPGFAQGYHDLGAILQFQGRVEDAVKWYRAALSVEPDYVAAHRDLGKALLALGRDEQAAHHLSQARRLEARDPADGS